MSAFNSSSSFGSFATPLPACDAWGNILLGNSSTATSLVAGSGISSVSRISAGVHGVTFSDANRFGGGAYVFLVTPEYSSQSVGPFIVAGVKQGGVTAPGFSAGFALSCFGFQTPAVAGGFTINGPLDISANTVWANVAAFAFKVNTDIRSTTVSNYLNYSENFANWTQTDSATRFVLATDQVAPNGSTNVFVYTGANTQNFVSQETPFVNKVGTYSVHAKSGTGLTLDMLIGGDGNNFGYAVNTVTDAMVARGTVPSGGSLTGSVQSLSDGWKRIRLTFSSPNTAAPIVRADAVAEMDGKTIYVWGAQLEEGSLATQYVKTEAVSPVLGNQDAKKRFVPGASGYGLTGATYSSCITALNSTRTPTAYGTIVVPARRGSATDSSVAAYIEGGYNVSGVSAGDFSVFDVSFSKPLNTANYCVILSRETEPEFADPDHAQTYEYAIAAIDRSNKTANGFRAFTLKQSITTNGMVKSGVSHLSGLNERIHFMVFGGGTYGQP